MLVQMVNYNAKNIQFNNIRLTHALHTELPVHEGIYVLYVCIGMYMYVYTQCRNPWHVQVTIKLIQDCVYYSLRWTITTEGGVTINYTIAPIGLHSYILESVHTVVSFTIRMVAAASLSGVVMLAEHLECVLTEETTCA